MWLCSQSYSQVSKAPVKLDLSEEMKEPSNSSIYDFLGEDESNYYLLRFKGSSGFYGIGSGEGYILESYDKQLHFKVRRELDVPLSGKDAIVDNVLYLGNTIYLFTVDNDKKSGTSKLYYQTIDKKTLLASGTPRLLVSIPYESKRTSGSFSYAISRNKNVLAIAGIAGDEKSVKQKFKVAVMNAQMEMYWEKEITLPYDSKLFAEDKVKVDDSGNLYALGRLYKGKVTEKRHGDPNYSYKILAYRDKGATQKEYAVALRDEFVTDLGFNITDDGHIVCGGFYSQEGTFSIKGTYFMLIDAANGQVIRKGTKAFEPDFLELFMSEGKAEKGKELFEYDLDNIIPRSDGGALLLAEQYYVTVRTYTSTMNGITSTRTTSYYHYNSVIAVNVNPDMSIAWATKIPKQQVTTDDGGYFSSYEDAVVGDKIFLVFNDNPDNLLITDPKKIKNFNGRASAATLVTLTSDGKWKKSLLFSNKEEGVILRPKVCEQINQNQFFLYAERGKNFIIGRIEM
jgi:hypothetical protein